MQTLSRLSADPRQAQMGMRETFDISKVCLDPSQQCVLWPCSLTVGSCRRNVQLSSGWHWAIKTRAGLEHRARHNLFCDSRQRREGLEYISLPYWGFRSGCLEKAADTALTSLPRQSLITFVNKHLNKLNLEVTDLETQVSGALVEGPSGLCF